MQDLTSWSILRLLDDTELLKQEGLLWPSQFARECRDRGLPMSEDELEYYERRGWLAPLLRIPQTKLWFKARGDGFVDEVEVPEGAEPEPGLEYRYSTYSTTSELMPMLRDEGLLSDPRGEPFRPWREYRDPQTREEIVSTYYVLYQLLHVLWLRERVELDEHWRHVGPSDAKWEKYFRVRKNRLPRERRRLRQHVQDLDHLVLFLLAIQNRYRPEITGTVVDYHNLDDWFAYRDRFSTAAVLAQLPATSEQLRNWRDHLCHQGKKVDPLAEWYDLVGYVNWSKREKLGGPARLAQELYVMVEMIDRFLRDWARERGTLEPPFTCLGQPEYEQRVYGGRTINFRDRDILEHILTEYGLNPRPRVLFVVEGETEFQTVPMIAEAIGVRLADFGIELHNIEGVDKDIGVLANLIAPPRLGAPLEPGLYAAARQTRVYVHFDREGQWQNDVTVAKYISEVQRRLRALLPPDLPEPAKDRAVERGVTVERWQQSFELDNFSDEELAEAISAYAREKGWPAATVEDVAECRRRFPNKSLDGVIAQKVRALSAPGAPPVKDKDFEWDKVSVGRSLVGKLVERMAQHQLGEPSKAPIIDVILHVVQMARENWP